MQLALFIHSYCECDMIEQKKKFSELKQIRETLNKGKDNKINISYALSGSFLQLVHIQQNYESKKSQKSNRKCNLDTTNFQAVPIALPREIMINTQAT